MASAADAIPELRRFVVSDGKSVAMEPTLTKSLAAFDDAAEANLPTIVDLPTPAPGQNSPVDPLDLLRQAYAHLRAGNWPGFGTALQELEDLLERLSESPKGEGN